MLHAKTFRFKSKLLKGKTTGLSSLITLAGGQDINIKINDLLAMAGADRNTPKIELDEAKAELNAVF